MSFATRYIQYALRLAITVTTDYFPKQH